MSTKPQVLSVGLPFLVVELASRDALRRTAPNWAAYNQFLPLDGAISLRLYPEPAGRRRGHPCSNVYA
jgi:trans-2,3-dihydro-3-hydroxyanthranilate isomerase